jgi:hypothetical protein
MRIDIWCDDSSPDGKPRDDGATLSYPDCSMDQGGKFSFPLVVMINKETGGLVVSKDMSAPANSTVILGTIPGAPSTVDAHPADSVKGALEGFTVEINQATPLPLLGPALQSALAWLLIACAVFVAVRAIILFVELFDDLAQAIRSAAIAKHNTKGGA